MRQKAATTICSWSQGLITVDIVATFYSTKYFLLVALGTVEVPLSNTWRLSGRVDGSLASHLIDRKSGFPFWALKFHNVFYSHHNVYKITEQTFDPLETEFRAFSQNLGFRMIISEFPDYVQDPMCLSGTTHIWVLIQTQQAFGSNWLVGWFRLNSRLDRHLSFHLPPTYDSWEQLQQQDTRYMNLIF